MTGHHLYTVSLIQCFSHDFIYNFSFLRWACFLVSLICITSIYLHFCHISSFFSHCFSLSFSHVSLLQFPSTVYIICAWLLNYLHLIYNLQLEPLLLHFIWIRHLSCNLTNLLCSYSTVSDFQPVQQKEWFFLFPSWIDAFTCGLFCTLSHPRVQYFSSCSSWHFYLKLQLNGRFNVIFYIFSCVLYR